MPLARIFLIVLAILAALPVLGAREAVAQRIQWYVEVLDDPISGRPILEARILTRDGYRFRLMRMKDNSIWGQFSLPRSSQAMLTPDRLPIYRIDENDPVDLEELKELEVGGDPTLYAVAGRDVQFIIWGDAREGFIPPILRQMMLGETIHVTYFTLLGERQSAELTLNRANQAIAQFLRVRPLDPEKDSVEDQTQTFSLIARRFTELCDDMRFSGSESDYTACRNTFYTCSEAPEQTAESFKQCLGFDPAMLEARDEPPAAEGDAETAGAPETKAN
ncbi:hypothetical protein [Thalassobaculum litoreum]|uniref:Uncharacterized protein n=1 Tax=Thalassobaculum litoreum DSM 18839 TaxID=1123362 RepID=A0A8G2BLH0_9PROT|nr:hypothetical protein [Thalassobaculum litoreum]SDG39804.1 hypothetical protein SAMN05660686_04263 [Thalassobaculum litoreum DSM 18839]